MIFSDKVYNVLKWIVMLALPAISVFIGDVGLELGVNNPEVVVKVINAVTVLLGSLIAVSTFQHSKDERSGR